MKKWFWGTVTTAFLLLILLQITPQEFVYRYFVAGRAHGDEITNLIGTTGQIGKEDIQWGSGLPTDTFSITGYNGATVALTRLPSLYANVASIIKGQWYVAAAAGDQCDAAVEGSLAWIGATLAGDPATVVMPGNYSYTCDTSWELPSNVVLVPVNGAKIVLGDGVTLTASGALNLSMTSQPVFSGTAGGGTETLVVHKMKDPGDVAWIGADLTISGLENCSPEWWGENTTPGTTDMTSEINSSLSSCPVTNLNNETYNISDKLVIRPFSSLLGKNNGGSGTVIYQADGSNIAEAMIVSAGWVNDSVSADGPIVIKDIFVNGNKASNSGATTHGIELMSWNCLLENVQVYGTTGDGIRFTDQNSAGSNLTSTAVENAVIHCRVTQVDGSGIYTESHTSALTDGKIVNSTIGSVGEYGIMAGAGWKVNNNHLYDIGFDGIATTDGFNNITNNNSIQDWGQSSTVGTRYGIVNYSIANNNPCLVDSNQVELSTVTAGSTYYAFGATFAAGSTSGLISLTGNQAQLAGAERFFVATGTGTGTANLFSNTVQNPGATLIVPNANLVRHVNNSFDINGSVLAGSGTPSVIGGSFFSTSSTNIIYSDFTGGFIGQKIYVVFAYAPGTGYVDFTSTNLKGNGGADWIFSQYDSMSCVYNGTSWFCSISDNTL